ncbi:MAG: bifunctional (p)ppGpp synthetase/guanosine-3',5'-bis(diphosphate) 3'-pyrophosphohydrolase [Candidatus Spechtbacterales bacterium]|nr:bifunctional (p)ppGpp synthetase/guanosine-3',5'-bis(diphosphate) 3'-pyrophosphohydrolase [Candidatus Spechtbacterales bacterium]
MKKTLDKKLEQIQSFYPDPSDKQLIQKAYDIAEEAHSSQKRESGEPYIVHPLDAALTLAEMDMDPATIAAALLHDVVDDTPVTLEEIDEIFGKEIAFLVEGVSKLGKIKYRGVERHAENLRKMLVATAKDVRVILIKFADRLHNMKTLEALPERKQKRIALETLDIYAPIATRLGVAEMAKQLEDLAFPYLYPEEYDYIKNEANYRFRDAQNYLRKLKPTLNKELAKENIRPLKIEIRAKHYYSLWRKLEKYDHNWSQIYDLTAVRIIVDNIEECYRVLGIIHKLWKPLPGRIKDYIALPKPSGYRSLHTTVFAVDGRITEIQIRTPEMHQEAEFGVAAHWKYKNRSGQHSHDLAKTYNWVKGLQEWKKETAPSEELIDNLKIDVFSDRIFAFTPNGDVIDLPQGATAVDFAYSIHSEIGDRCAAAIANGKIVPLSYELQNGDVMEIITSKKKTPSQTWLSFVKTRAARNRIRAWFKKEDLEQNIAAGEEMLDKELKALEGKSWDEVESKKQKEVVDKFKYKNEDQLFAAIGHGDISVGKVAKTIVGEPEEEIAQPTANIPSRTPTGVTIAGISGIQKHIAKCCNPVPPEKIAAYITVGKGASIHKIKCENLHKSKGQDKILPAFWSGDSTASIININIKVSDRVGLLQDISRAISELGVNIASLNSNTGGGGDFIIYTEMQIHNVKQLKRVIDKLNSIDGVLSVERKN